MGFSGFNFIPLFIGTDNYDLIRKSQEGDADSQTLTWHNRFLPSNQDAFAVGHDFQPKAGLAGFVGFPVSSSHITQPIFTVLKCPRHIGDISFKPPYIGNN